MRQSFTLKLNKLSWALYPGGGEGRITCRKKHGPGYSRMPCWWEATAVSLTSSRCSLTGVCKAFGLPLFCETLVYSTRIPLHLGLALLPGCVCMCGLEQIILGPVAGRPGSPGVVDADLPACPHSVEWLPRLPHDRRIPARQTPPHAHVRAVAFNSVLVPTHEAHHGCTGPTTRPLGLTDVE